MAASVEKTYSEALFSLVAEESGEKSSAVTDMLSELEAVEKIFAEVPEFLLVMDTPVVSAEEKGRLIDEAFSGKISGILLNFLKVLSERHRIGSFGRIVREFRTRYNEVFGIIELTVTTVVPLSVDLRDKIRDKMEKLTQKKILFKEKTDPSLIGGIVLDYGSTRLDGSVKTRLEALKNDIAGIIA
ncbi:MAG: ATP synthase F1 subunit delta [Eubacterium sp.]|jgi:F-type H+-transporting ATPase subunit delta|nr:ATP synthase F1 subunit delta [Eubacterium sp.]